MSNQVYIILRDNKEKGPYSLEELLQFSLKPHDLIWVEGGASWRSPSEIEALKLNIPQNNPQRTETHSGRIFISYPKNSPATTTGVASLKPEIIIDNSASTVESEEELTAESLEIKADKIYQRVLAYNNQKQQHQESKAPEGAHTLQELKQEYALWQQGKKKKEKITKSKKRLLIQAGIAGIIASGLFIAIPNISAEKKTSKPTQLYITNTIVPVTTKAPNIVTPQASNENQNITTSLIVQGISLTAPVTGPKELSVDEFIDSVRQVMARQDRINNLPRRKK